MDFTLVNRDQNRVSELKERVLLSQVSDFRLHLFSVTLPDWLKDLPIHATFPGVQYHLRTCISTVKIAIMALWNFMIY